MSRVMIKCPVTDRSVDTGLGMPREQFDTTTMGNGSMECPACGHMHIWGKDDAWLEG